MAAVEVVFTLEFLERWIELKYSDQKRVLKALKLFGSNPSHNSLRLKKRESDGHWEISFSQAGRILFDWADEKTRRRAVLLSVGWHHIVE